MVLFNFSSPHRVPYRAPPPPIGGGCRGRAELVARRQYGGWACGWALHGDDVRGRASQPAGLALAGFGLILLWLWVGFGLDFRFYLDSGWIWVGFGLISVGFGVAWGGFGLLLVWISTFACF